MKRREAGLAVPAAIERMNRTTVSVKEMIDRYLDEYERVRHPGKTKRATLTAISKSWLGEVSDSALTSQKLVEYAQWRMEAAVSRRKLWARIYRIWVQCCPLQSRHGDMTSPLMQCRMRASSCEN